jgi:hypothetical protein
LDEILTDGSGTLIFGLHFVVEPIPSEASGIMAFIRIRISFGMKNKAFHSSILNTTGLL